MFFIKANVTGESGGNTSNIRVLGKLQLTVETGELYSFQYESDDIYVIGESIIPIEQGRIGEIVKKLKAGNQNVPDVDNNLLSLVVVDSKAGKAILFRNLTNSRPVYYYSEVGNLYCSSHLNLLKKYGVLFEPDESVLPEYYTYRILVAPRTFCKNIYRLAGGELKVIDIVSGSETDNRFIPLGRPAYVGNIDFSEITEQLGEYLKKSVNDTFTHYDTSGVLLSGGADSSLLAAVGVNNGHALRSVSTSFSFINQDDGEEEYARTMADFLNLKHEIYKGTAESYLTGLVESIYHNEEPVDHLQSVMLYLLFDYCRGDNKTVFLCGESADGLFGNDQHIWYYDHSGKLCLFRKTGMHGLFRAFMGSKTPDNYRLQMLSKAFDDNMSGRKHYLWMAGQYADIDLVQSHFNCSEEDVVDTRRSLLKNYDCNSLLDLVSAVYFICQSSSTMSTWGKLAESRGSALHFPFGRPELITYLMSLPWDLKVKEKKYLIRRLLRHNSIPEEMISRPKRSFGFPPGFWAVKDSLFQPLVDMAGSMYDKKLLESLQVTRTPTAMLLWNMLNYYIWKRLFIDDIKPDEISSELIDRHSAQNKRVL